SPRSGRRAARRRRRRARPRGAPSCERAPEVPAEEVEEERPARERGHHTDGELDRPEHRARERVRPREEDGAAQEGGREEEALVRPEDETQEVRHDEPHEADHAAHRHRGPDQQRGGEEDRPPARAPRATIAIAPSAPANAASGTTGETASAPATSASTPATAAPPEMPSRWGQASGLPSRACSAAPAAARLPPTTAPSSTRG